MKIREFSVTKLFGYLDYSIPFKHESIAILHGPNGCGKTTILKLLKAITDVDVLTLKRTSFESLRIMFTDERTLEVFRDREQVPEKQARRQGPRWRFVIRFKLTPDNDGKKEYKAGANPQVGMEFPPSYYERQFPELVRMGPRVWQNRESGEMFTLEDLQLVYGAGGPGPRPEHPEWLKEIVSGLAPHLIQTQRLFRFGLAPSEQHYGHESQPRANEVVEIYSEEIKELISKKLAESVTIAQSKDRTFPTRLLTQQIFVNIVEAELRQKFNEVEEKRKRLIAVGMLGDEQSLPLPDKEMADMEKKVLWLYLQDVEEKLQVFDDLQKRIHTFMEILNMKLNPKGKSINVSKDRGLMFESRFGDKTELAIKELSSGEQHQVVLFYELLFKTIQGALILIDEPEISLHVNWQRMFLSDLESVVRLTKQNVVIATHSPQIINNRWDLTVALDGGVRNES